MKKAQNNLPRGMRARKRRRKNGNTVIYYFGEVSQNGKRVEISLGTEYFVAVKKWAEINIEKISPSQSITFSQAADKYFAEVIEPKGKVNTINGVKNSIKSLKTFFSTPKDAPLHEITPQHLNRFLAWRSSAPSSANVEIAFFSAIFEHAQKSGYIDFEKKNPVKGVKKNKVEKRDNYVNDNLFDLVYEHADQQMRDLMDIALLTGQRPIDICSLHTSQISDGILNIKQAKTSARLRFEISGSLKEIIDRIEPENGFLFLNKHGKPLNRQLITNWFLNLRKQIMQERPELEEELRNFQFRDLRAKAATDAYLQNDKETARELLGHTSTNMTNRYIRQVKVQKPFNKKKK